MSAQRVKKPGDGRVSGASSEAISRPRTLHSNLQRATNLNLIATELLNGINNNSKNVDIEKVKQALEMAKAFANDQPSPDWRTEMHAMRAEITKDLTK